MEVQDLLQVAIEVVVLVVEVHQQTMVAQVVMEQLILVVVVVLQLVVVEIQVQEVQE